MHMQDRTNHWAQRTMVMTLATLSLGACSSGQSGSGTSTTIGAAPTRAVPPAAATPSPSVQLVDITKGAALAADPSVVVIDVRTPAEYATGHLARAELVDIHATDFPTRIAQFDRSATYLVYCHSGNRSGQATAFMATLGFTSVYDLDGGITAWQNAGANVVN
jgi:rhodanese-related sulfurtransferase